MLGAGEGFLVEPEVLTYYQADSEEPWSYLWIGFSGKYAKEYLIQIAAVHTQMIGNVCDPDSLRIIIFNIADRTLNIKILYRLPLSFPRLLRKT